MSCSSVDLKALVLGEGTAEERRAARAHTTSCEGCREELARLQSTHTALLALREEEPPRRIAFVSDKEIAPAWWQFWHAVPQWLFAVPAMLGLLFAVALALPVLRPTAPVTVVLRAPAPPASAATLPDAEVERRVQAAVTKAVADSEARQSEKTAQLLAAADRKHQMDLRGMQVAFEEDWRVKMKQLGTLYVAVNRMDAGGAR